MLAKLNPEDSASILEELDDEEAAELMAALPVETIIRTVDEMAPDEAADLLAEMEPQHHLKTDHRELLFLNKAIVVWHN